MRKQPPKNLLKSEYRREMWRNVENIVSKIKKVLPISEMHLMGSFNSRKKRPSDIDFIVLLKTPVKQNKKWSVDLVIVPDNAHGNELLEDNKKWVKQKYGTKSGHVRWL